MNTNINDNKNRFIEIYKKSIQRQGADKLLDWLINESDFFTAPASTRYHGSYEGGLCRHSLNVYERLVTKFPNTSAADSFEMCGLLHDICKANFYTVEMRNQKIDGKWEQVPYYAVDDKLPYGHGEKSVYIISGFMKLNRDEAMAIRWHMGGFDESVKGGSYSMSAAFEMYPLCVMLHTADMMATYLDEAKD